MPKLFLLALQAIQYSLSGIREALATLQAALIRAATSILSNGSRIKAPEKFPTTKISQVITGFQSHSRVTLPTSLPLLEA